jgi:hypothetical protein
MCCIILVILGTKLMLGHVVVIHTHIHHFLVALISLFQVKGILLLMDGVGGVTSLHYKRKGGGYDMLSEWVM